MRNLMHAPPWFGSIVIVVLVGCGPAPRAYSPDAGDGGDADVCEVAMCSAAETCCDGSCSTDESCGLALHEVSPPDGFVGGGRYVTLRGAGFSPGMRVFIGDGRAPVRVIDSETALIVTPPAVQGYHDVRIEVGGEAATRREAFGYHAYGFTDEWLRVDMVGPRGNEPAMTTLQDGRLLVLGGTADGSHTTALATAELYDPVTRTVSLAANLMEVPRFTATAITLLDGRVLVVGVCNVPPGANGCSYPDDRGVAEIFDPALDRFSTLASGLVDPSRRYINAVLLPDGRVLLQSFGNRTAEIFDPDTSTFSLFPTASSFTALGRPARLRDGRVVFLSQEGVEVLDPDTGVLAPLVGAGALSSRALASFTMPDGRVLVPGGQYNDGTYFVPSAAIAVFDPAAEVVTELPQALSSPRMLFASSLLRDGRLMVAGGVEASYPNTWWCGGSFTFPTTAAVDAIDPITGTISPFTALPDPNMGLVATTLLDGSIIVGGGSPCGTNHAEYPYLYYLESVASPI